MYTLLTGTLPFDDDDERVMKDKVISGVFEDPEWLSEEARDLVKAVLHVDPEKRLTIAQMLEHGWFTSRPVLPVQMNASRSSLSIASRPTSPVALLHPPSSSTDSQLRSAVSGKSDSTYHSASSEFPTSVPTTPDHDVSEDVFGATSSTVHVPKINGVSYDSETPEPPPPRPSFPRHGSNSTSNKVPPALPTRTPARTKRRSVSSTLSDPSTPTFEKSAGSSLPQDFSSILQTPAPLIFSTALERDLLNSMSALGLDTGQIVHSVLSDACDATGALWWMLKRKAEKRMQEEGDNKAVVDTMETDIPEETKQKAPPRPKERKTSVSACRSACDTPPSSAVQTVLSQTHSAPELQLIPPTPTAAVTARPVTPPRTKSPTNQLLSPTPSMAELSVRSHPSTPGGSLKDKDPGSKRRGNRSGSVSIMQRATTALEAAGLVRKKSAEGVREEKEKDRERSSDKRAASGSGEEPRASHGSGSSKLAKSPPMKSKDALLPATPPPSLDHSVQGQVGSPWVMANTRGSPPPTGTDSPRDTLSALPNIAGSKTLGSSRNRASLLSAFRMWFKEDPKGKRKEGPVLPSQPVHAYPHSMTSPGTNSAPGRGRGAVKRRVSGSRGKFPAGRQSGGRSKRTSVSSRRSSSVNSHRSSIHSAMFPTLESPGYPPDQMVSMTRRRSDGSRRSFGSHTPNSERDDFSRPPSIQSFTHQRHRKSPSASSAGSMHPGRTASPLSKYHRRAGSGSSTRVVRQAPHIAHLRSNSASSAHSLASSRPGSLYDLSESDSRRNNSPHKSYSRRSLEETPRRNHTPTTFVAHKRQTPFSNPSGSNSYLNSLGRSSWKKSWGLEPPGWQTRSAYSAIEVLSISPPPDSQQGIRDVFSRRQSLSMGDESDWVDEDDDVAGYAGGLGQMPTSAASASPTFAHQPDPPLLSPPPRGHGMRSGVSKRSTASAGLTAVGAAGRGTRSKGGRSPGGRSSPLPNETFEQPEQRGGRRQLPPGRSGPAFRHPIQEEDEGEEE
ncbi:uncharacterized protein FIBRA_06521 [Fibroporia radiculosa]|uniref:non-specific serine/threonine protein kinase n=1 Tax=Fibroporia radiculosa TaxID=599839 RepID=J4H444_9APHY|nr:uncharacterized protein FIBRA_06521 [Fibroporia radiculosa]CCM04349.1 predicted protein [Fibroporia radiculosa]